MAKKAAAPAGWNMSQAIRDHLTANPSATAAEALEALSAQNPKLNKSSFSVAFYTTKKKMTGGHVSDGRKKKKAFGVRSKGKQAITGLNVEALKAAARLVAEVGADAAVQYVKAIESVQVK